jgi:hypothetical protein
VTTTIGGLSVGPRWSELARARHADADVDADDSDGGGASSEGHRRWTVLGSLGEEGELDAPRGVVDASGLVTAPGLGCSVDWWVGADDRWHFPSREAAVRQHLVHGAPVVETAMRVPGGDVVHRAYGVRDRAGEPVVVLEIRNSTPVPVAIALAARPYGLTELLAVQEARIEGARLEVDGHVVARTVREPGLAAAACGREGDVADAVTDGALAGGRHGVRSASARCDDGSAQAVAVHPLPHATTLYVTIPLSSTATDRGSSVPPSEQVSSGWRTHLGRATRVELPPGRVRDAFEAARGATLLAATGVGSPDEGTTVPVDDRCAIASALASVGFVAEASSLLAGLAGTVDPDGGFVSSDPRHDAPASLLHVLDRVARVGDDPALPEALLPQVVGLAGVVGRRFRTGITRRLRPGPTGPQPPWLGAAGGARDDLYGLAGLLAAASLLARAGEHRAAEAVRRDANAVRGLVAWLDDPGQVSDQVALGDLVAWEPLHLVEPTSATAARLLDAAQGVAPGVALDVGPAVVRPGTVRPDPRATLLVAAAELGAGRSTALDRLDWLVAAASPTWTWPEVVDPVTGEGASGDGCDAAIAAGFVSLVRDLVVRDRNTTLELLGVLPPAWRGQAVEVHDLPVSAGRFSFALRWHGERPAILWELQTRGGAEVPTLVAPGLDPTWRGRGAAGESLLAPHPGGPPGEDVTA